MIIIIRNSESSNCACCLLITFSIIVPYNGAVIVWTTDNAGADACWIIQAPFVKVTTIYLTGLAFQA
jgi:hypothetical protein